jgi:hypothetical protein
MRVLSSDQFKLDLGERVSRIRQSAASEISNNP